MIQYIFSKFPFLNNCNYKLSTWVSSSYHELIQNAFSNHILYNKHNHKLSTNMTFCSYELISYFQASFLRKTKITNFLLSWTVTIYIFKLPFLRITEITNWTLLTASYHELIQNFFSNHIFKNKFKYILSTCMTFCSHKLIQNVFSW